MNILQKINLFLAKNIQLLSHEIRKPHYEYEIFGKQFEKFVSNEISNFLNSENIVHRNAFNKNEFPDIRLIDPKIAIDIKCGSHYSKKGSILVKTNNSQNDLGTIRSWTKKIEEFTEIYFIFVEYSLTPLEREINRITFRPFYEYLGVKNDIISYRLKDGNLRPKNFAEFDTPHITSYDNFKHLLKATDRNRSIKLAKEHLRKLDKEDISELLKELNITQSV